MDKQGLLEIGIRKRNGEIKQSWNELARGHFPSGEDFRVWVKDRVREDAKRIKTAETIKESVDINADGSHSSHKGLRMSIEEAKDPAYLLRAHGYDVDAWDLVSSQSNIWNAYSKQDGIMQLYSSKIKAKPRKIGGPSQFSLLLDVIAHVKSVQIDIELIVVADKGLLEISLFDQHFGLSDYEYYKPTQNRIAHRLMSGKWQETLFVVGQDLFHNNDFRGNTANGTPIEMVDTAKAWGDALQFYSPLIELSIKQSKRVKIIYSKGNHDEALSWAFVQILKAMYPAATYDDAMVERKAHVFGLNFIGITHGDKARKNLHNLFPVEFPLEWATAKNREVHTGHIHKEDAADVFGMMVRTLSTRNKTDKWHKDNGFNGAHKRFMLFEYSADDLEGIYYV